MHKKNEDCSCPASIQDENSWPKPIRETAAFLFQSHYDDLVGIARALRRRKQLSDTLLTSDLVHEAFLRLRQTEQWNDNGHFLSSVALSMRHVSIDHARARASQKRGDNAVKIPLEEDQHAKDEGDLDNEEAIDIHNLMQALAEISPRQAQIVDCRFFAGFTNEETAKILDIDERTVRRDWTKARAWFAQKLAP